MTKTILGRTSIDSGDFETAIIQIINYLKEQQDAAGEIEIPPPEIELLNPANGTTNVPETTDVLVATFDKPINWGFAGGVYLRDAAGALIEVMWAPVQVVSGAPGPAQMSIISNELHVNFAAALAPATGYYVIIDGATIQNFGGVYSSSIWAFTTPGGTLPAADMTHTRFLMPYQPPSVATDVAGVAADLNTLLDNLQNTGMMERSSA